MTITDAASNGREAAVVAVQASVVDSTLTSRLRPGIEPLVASDSVLGLVVNEAGQSRAITNPVAGRRLVLARIAGAPSGAWHVLVVTRSDTVADTGLHTYKDSATIWHGVLDERLRWRSFSRVASMGKPAARLEPEFASGIATSGDDVAFAYVVGDNPFTARVVLLHSRERIWRTDTLKFRETGAAVRVISHPGGGWLVTHTSFDMTATRFADGWSLPQVIARTSTNTGLYAPRLIAAEPLPVAWWAEDDPRGYAMIRTARVPGTSTTEVSDSRTVRTGFLEFSGNTSAYVAPLGIVWILASNQDRGVDVLLQQGDGEVRPVGSLSVSPGLRSFAVAKSSDEIWWFVDGLKEATRPRSSLLFRLRLSCN